MRPNLAVFATHPIQYQVPMWRILSKTDGLDCTVFYFSDHSVTGATDNGFGVEVAWDIPLLDGYNHTFLQRNADLEHPRSVTIDDPQELLTRGRYTAVLIPGYMFGFERQAATTARRMGLKTIMRGELTDRPYRRGAFKSFLRNIYLRRFYRSIDCFCYIGEDARQHLIGKNIGSDRMFFSPYSIDTALFNKQKALFNKKDARSGMGIPDDAVVILYSGKFIPRKAPLVLANAVAALKHNEKTHLVLVGDGELRDAVRSALQPILGDRLHMPGFVNQSKMGFYYAAADLFVLPSEYETWGLVVNEAMQFGLPAIVSDRIGCRKDLIIEGKTGFSFEADNVGSLAERIETCLNNPELVAVMGGNAARHIEKYSTEASAGGIVQALDL